jgi:uncharacterized protein YndB with AHSA1/START domain
MPDQSVIHNTFVIERNFAATPERVFAAFADPAKKLRWYSQGEHHDVEEFELDFRVGGTELSRYRFKENTPFNGVPLVNQGSFQDIVPNQRFVSASTMTMGDKRISSSLVTIELLPAGTGTDLICTHQGAFFEGSDGPVMREAGWRTLFDRLGKYLSS